MRAEVLHDDGVRRWLFLGRDPERPGTVIDTNEYVVTHHGKAALLDPGGVEVFPQVIAAVTRYVAPEDIELLFGSHQDPDIISSLPLWLAICPGATVLVPSIWTGFIAHFAIEARITGVPDEGMPVALGGSSDLQAMPAHYLHSSSNFHVYDPTAKILFTGDVGAALLPEDETAVIVENFDRHVRYMEGFHRRWMPSNDAKRDWIERVRLLDVRMLCPQHGACFAGRDVERFLEWFDHLEVGSALRARS